VSVRAHIRVPATSANLGPGYDCAGLSLGLYDDLTVELIDSPSLQIVVTGEGADSVPTDDSHLVIRSIARGFQEAGRDLPSMRLTCHNRIPHGRGLGSSSAAIVGGLALARELLPGGGSVLPDRRMLEIATEIEGHPDNVAPAILGGLTIAWTPTQEDSRCAEAVRLTPNSRLQPVMAIPSNSLATEQARELLPQSVPHAVAAANGARAALLVPALTSHPDLLFTATHDLLHQHFRRFAYPQAYALMMDLRGRGIPAMISGAGPSVIALGVCDTELDGEAVGAHMASAAAASDDIAKAEFKVLQVPVDLDGVSAFRVS
jgi:homoserine kinase